MDGTRCSLAKLACSQVRKKGTLDVEYGLATGGEGPSRSVEAIPGNTGDRTAGASRVEGMKGRSQLQPVVLDVDRGMLTGDWIKGLSQAAGIERISELSSPQLRAPMGSGAFRIGRFD